MPPGIDYKSPPKIIQHGWLGVSDASAGEDSQLQDNSLPIRRQRIVLHKQPEDYKFTYEKPIAEKHDETKRHEQNGRIDRNIDPSNDARFLAGDHDFPDEFQDIDLAMPPATAADDNDDEKDSSPSLSGDPSVNADIVETPKNLDKSATSTLYQTRKAAKRRSGREYYPAFGSYRRKRRGSNRRAQLTRKTDESIDEPDLIPDLGEDPSIRAFNNLRKYLQLSYGASQNAMLREAVKRVMLIKGLVPQDEPDFHNTRNIIYSPGISNESASDDREIDYWFAVLNREISQFADSKHKRNRSLIIAETVKYLQSHWFL